jgi:hypothetical protein
MLMASDDKSAASSSLSSHHNDGARVGKVGNDYLR